VGSLPSRLSPPAILFGVPLSIPSPSGFFFERSSSIMFGKEIWLSRSLPRPPTVRSRLPVLHFSAIFPYQRVDREQRLPSTTAFPLFLVVRKFFEPGWGFFFFENVFFYGLSRHDLAVIISLRNPRPWQFFTCDGHSRLAWPFSSLLCGADCRHKGCPW